MDNEELKPCPFCGCEVVRDFQPFERRGHVIDCNRCNGGFHEMSRELAVEAWNTRAALATPAVLDEPTEAMKRAEFAIREFADIHGPSGGAWNISTVLDCLRKSMLSQRDGEGK